MVNWLTQRNYGFSDAADLFVFISGYTASFIYGRMMLERGFVIAGTRLIRRAWQIYVAHIVLFVMYIAEVGFLAHRYGNPNLEHEFNIAGFMANPAEPLYQGLILAFKPVNMDVLPLYILLMVVFPPVLWAMLRLPNLALTASFLLYVAARHFDWNLAAFPTGVWYFNPFCWQFLFVFGGWFALGGSIEARPLIRSRALLWLGCAYLLFAFVMTLAGRFPQIGYLMPSRPTLRLTGSSISSCWPSSSIDSCRASGRASDGRYSGRSSRAGSNRWRSSAPASSSPWLPTSCSSRSPMRSGCRSS